MRKHVMNSAGFLALSTFVLSILLAGGCRPAAQPTAAGASDTAAAFDPHDISGIWIRSGSRAERGSDQGGAPFPEAGDAGFGNDVPTFTSEGQKMFDAIKPGNGRLLGSPDAADHPEEHIGRRRAVPGKFQNDPTARCTPPGWTRALLISYAVPVEIVQAKDRVIQHVEWYNEWREVFTDGRTLPAEPNVLRWNGLSVGRWEGNTFVVESSGFEQNSWVDHFGYPHSDQMRLEERYQRIAPDKLELTMTINDPKVYAQPWVSQKKTFRLMTGEETMVEDKWSGVFEQRCVPEEEFAYNETFRDRVVGSRDAK